MLTVPAIVFALGTLAPLTWLSVVSAQLKTDSRVPLGIKCALPRITPSTHERNLMAQYRPRELSWAELDEEMYALIEAGKDDTPRFAALQREHDRREK
jgi:hypothetical protein